MSFDREVASMKRIASAVLTSAEKTAASPSAPSSGGRPSVSTSGTANSGFVKEGS